MKQCKNCGATLKENSFYCTECGTKIQMDEVQDNKKEILANVRKAVANKNIILMFFVAIISIVAITSYMITDNEVIETNNFYTVDHKDEDYFVVLDIDID